MAEHVDKTRLYTDLSYRFKFLSKFIEFTQDDISNLHQLLLIINSKLPVIVDAVYRKLFSFDVTKRYFLLRHDGFETFCPVKDSGVTLDNVQMEYRKDMLSVYLRKVLSETNWNETFLEYLSRIGQIHTNKYGSSSINVDYMYINALLCYLEQLLNDSIWDTDNSNVKIKYNLMKSLKKFFYIQNDFLAVHYQNNWKDEKSCLSTPIVKLSKCLFL